MSEFNDGGPAFPAHENWRFDSGMTMRDYFAAHAPMPIPDWFKHEAITPRPIRPEIPLHFSAKQRDEVSLMEQGEIGVVPEFNSEVGVFFTKLCEFKTKMEEWRNKQRCLKFFAWRMHYADQMIAWRVK